MFQGAIGPDGPTGEMGLEGKTVRNLLCFCAFSGIVVDTSPKPNSDTRVMTMIWENGSYAPKIAKLHNFTIHSGDREYTVN